MIFWQRVKKCIDICRFASIAFPLDPRQCIARVVALGADPMIVKRSADPRNRGARFAGKPYGEKIMRGGDDNTELARTSAGPPPPL